MERQSVSKNGLMLGEGTVEFSFGRGVTAIQRKIMYDKR